MRGRLEMEKWFKSELIKRAQQGDAEAGREILKEIVLAIGANRFDPLLFPFLGECLGLFLQDGIPLDRALCVEAVDQGGRPRKHDQLELAAVDILLRDHGGFSPEQAIIWIEEHVGVDRRTVQKARKVCDARYGKGPTPLMEALDLETLLHRSGSLRPTVAQALSGRKNPEQV